MLLYDKSGADVSGVVGPLEEGAALVLVCEVRGGKIIILVCSLFHFIYKLSYCDIPNLRKISSKNTHTYKILQHKTSFYDRFSAFLTRRILEIEERHNIYNRPEVDSEIFLLVLDLVLLNVS